MNILHINTLDIKGGAARVAEAIQNGLRDLGHESSMLVHHKYGNDKDIYTIPQTRIERLLSTLFASDINFWNKKWILSHDAYKKADIVHIHNIHGNYFSIETLQDIASEKPVIWTLHDMWAITGHNTWGYEGYEKPSKDIDQTIPKIEANPSLLWDLWFRKRLLFKKKASVYKKIKLKIIPVSFWLQNEIKGSILQDKETRVIHNGINTDVFKTEDKYDAREKLQLPQDKFIIGFVSVGGSNNPQKGWQYAEKVLEYFKNDTRIVFLSIGAKKPVETSSNIIYIDYISDQTKLASYYASLDVFLFTSVAENFPLVTLEAMACGAIIVSFDVGGTKEAVQNGVNGFIAKYRDVNDLIARVESAINLPNHEKEKIRMKNINDVKEKWSRDRMINEYLTLYNESKKK